MKNLEQEIIDFHCQQTKIANEQIALSKMEEAIIKKYCPYKKGDKVIFTEWWRENGKDYFGKVHSIRFKGITPDAIDNRWVICVIPTTKNFNKPLGSYNSSYKYLGKNEKDIIRKAELINIIDTTNEPSILQKDEIKKRSKKTTGR